MNLIKEKDNSGFVKLQITLSKYPSEVRKAIFKGLLKAAKQKIERERQESKPNLNKDPDFECYFD